MYFRFYRCALIGSSVYEKKISGDERTKEDITGRFSVNVHSLPTTLMVQVEQHEKHGYEMHVTLSRFFCFLCRIVSCDLTAIVNGCSGEAVTTV